MANFHLLIRFPRELARDNDAILDNLRLGRRLKTRPSLAVLDSQENYVNLMKWMKRNGFKPSQSPVRPAEFEGTGRGMVASRTISKGDCIVSVPRGLLLTTSTVLDSYLGPHLSEWRQLSAKQVLAIFLVCERSLGEESFWKPYIDTLPTSYTVPAYWKCPPRCTSPGLKRKISDQLSELRQAFKSARPFLSHLGDALPALKDVVTFRSFTWGWFTIHTRAVHYEHPAFTADGARVRKHPTPRDGNFALVPFLDLLNHSPLATVDAAFNPATQHYEIRTSTPCKKRSQVFISYGPHTSETLLLDYGFVAARNPEDAVSFTIDDLRLDFEEVDADNNKLRSSSPRVRLEILKNHGLLRSMSCSALEGASWNMRVVLRILALRDGEIDDWPLALQGVVSVENEAAVDDRLKTCLERKLKSIPTKEDLEQLAGSSEIGDRLVAAAINNELDILVSCLTTNPS